MKKVLSNQYCRCLDTARLLDLGTVEPAPMLNSIFEDRSTATQQIEQTLQQIIDHRDNSEVVIMVTHYANIIKIGHTPPEEGEAIVIKVDKQGDLKMVERIQDFCDILLKSAAFMGNSGNSRSYLSSSCI